ncbi:MAG: FadR/GntR family transcriptional regulator [Actinomycetota bacterium]|nr:FadR/GntR family transcriptional regulator [Actinomycetota bacterium]
MRDLVSDVGPSGGADAAIASASRAEPVTTVGSAGFSRALLTEQVVDHLTQLIADGTLPPGSFLPSEPELARQLGVSRTVVRESARVLAARGMIDIQRGRGSTVRAPSTWDIGGPLSLAVMAEQSELTNWLEVRAALEIASARYAARRARPAEHARLGEALAALDSNFDDPEAYAVADMELHLAIAAGSCNPQFERLLRPLLRPLRTHFTHRVSQPAVRSSANRQHAAIVEAIVAGDEAAAVEAMTSHFTVVAEEVREIDTGEEDLGADV